MSIELVYNCSGIDYWELLYQKDYGRYCLYEGHHGRYIGEVINNCVFDSQTGEYLGEIYQNRLIVNKSKKGKVKIKGNFVFHPMGRMGYSNQSRKLKIEIPSGYEEFTQGL